jgi:hypothetical protein
VMEGGAPWRKRTTAPITSTSRTELLRDDGRGEDELAPPSDRDLGRDLGAGAYREHRSDRDLGRGLSPARDVPVGIGAAPTTRRPGRPDARSRGRSQMSTCVRISGPVSARGRGGIPLVALSAQYCLFLR